MLGWTPATFWGSTAAEFRLAMEGRAGAFQATPTIDRDRVAEIAQAWGTRPSIRKPVQPTLGKARR